MRISDGGPIEEVANNAAIGAVAGVAATVAMTALMEASQRLGLMGDMPPWVITRRTLEKAGKRGAVPTPVQKLLATAMHVGFGALLGAAFVTGEDELRPPGPRIGHALAYGLAIWLVSYAGWVPALGLMPPPKRDQTGRQLTMLAGHAVFGAGLLVAARTLRAAAAPE